MFNLGFPELLALGGLALLVIGPQQLPEVAKVVARTLNELKRATKDITGTIAQVKTEATSKVNEFVDDISNEVGDVEEDYHNIDDENLDDELAQENLHENSQEEEEDDDDGQMSLLVDEETKSDRS